MKLALLSLLSLLLLGVSAQAAPLPVPSVRAPRLRLTKRVPGATSSTLEAAEKVLSAIREKGHPEKAVEESDWKRPVILSIGVAGLMQTAGWNYVAAKSFSDNRKKFNDAKRKAAELKDKPLPKVGDTLCTFETYRTQDEVENRTPSKAQAPCFQIATDATSASPNVAPPTTEDVGKQARARSGKTGGLTRRGLSPNTVTLGEMVKDTSTSLEHVPFLSHPASSSSSRLTELTRLHRPNLGTLEEHARLLSPASRHLSPSNSLVRQRLASLPGFPVLTPVESPKSDQGDRLLRDFSWKSSLDSNSVDEATSKLASHRWGWIKKARTAPTEDLVFALTILNSIGSIPSLTLTLINAYYYRGNPKVD
ncbi:uncharacterized protein PAN0_007d3174 [Moesziomyces antarcticus]|uniref:Uncharacterized protein n=2 Tax=Pseudozyma antarctica TaxID=84753 RepID=A0A081CE62_PSEA2|nr:uncharacterized protein PAN0_007d3174 [Moesziomyces antarcticus]GAK64958.1 hypothetical protein PAN0_007d3174 [Moesziomyces antarcticus]SPO46055.1 uncharacterized protein PSANT_03741 [Moesziomyces antarcticus]